MEQKIGALMLNSMDNVAVALENLKAGESISIQGKEGLVKVFKSIPYGHKIAVHPILKDEKVIKYGECMGIATETIPVGHHVHVSNVRGLNKEDKTAVTLKGGVEK
ncbi:UxaA family hydrolase [Planococcus beigongshangi]|uniref:UxaA family hydrolase n=1 Tax=Planococcus beigongshangi TaxID=2782536 RepID=UPI00193BE070|nr:UxaA family hydrolase [Planococcus beigongshangi]